MAGQLVQKGWRKFPGAISDAVFGYVQLDALYWLQFVAADSDVMERPVSGVVSRQIRGLSVSYAG